MDVADEVRAVPPPVVRAPPPRLQLVVVVARVPDIVVDRRAVPCKARLREWIGAEGKLDVTSYGVLRCSLPRYERRGGDRWRPTHHDRLRFVRTRADVDVGSRQHALLLRVSQLDDGRSQESAPQHCTFRGRHERNQLVVSGDTALR